MNYDEAIDMVNETCESVVDKDHRIALDLAISALGKQWGQGFTWTAIATDESGLTTTFKCPLCGEYTYIRYPGDKCNYEYCPHCGQKIGE